MPKPIYGYSGSGMHTHQSLFTPGGKNAFYYSKKPHGLSDIARYFIGGLIYYIKEISAILNPTVNSYKRLVPGYEAPTYISWAYKNRSALIRVPSERGKGTRCELRNPDVSGNPYLQFALMLAADLQGIENQIEPPSPVEKNIYELTPEQRKHHGIENFPESLGHALSFMEKSTLVRDVLGEHIFTKFLYVTQQQWECYRMQVAKWELDQYLPVL